MAEIRAMCAIGQRGQLGLNGRLPWEGNRGREYVADVGRFFDMTKGHVIIAGPRTYASIPDFAYLKQAELGQLLDREALATAWALTEAKRPNLTITAKEGYYPNARDAAGR